MHEFLAGLFGISKIAMGDGNDCYRGECGVSAPF